MWKCKIFGNENRQNTVYYHYLRTSADELNGIYETIRRLSDIDFVLCDDLMENYAFVSPVIWT